MSGSVGQLQRRFMARGYVLGGDPLMRVLLVLALLPLAVLPACAAEKICSPGQVAVETENGGRWCEEPEPGDPTCPDGEILLKNPDAGREGCIPNVYSPDPYTDQLPT